jgi:glycosyltransferase involved in cell wall biosynthesis
MADRAANEGTMRGSPSSGADRISVVIPCFNQAAYIEQCVESVLRQAILPEIIVVDDGSTDDSLVRLSAFADRISVISQPNQGVSAARNKGFRASTGSLLCFLDADENPNAGVYVADLQVVAADGSQLSELVTPIDNEDAFHSWMRRGWGPPMCFVIRRDSVISAGPFDEGLRANEEWDFWLRVAATGVRFQASAGAMAIYRVAPGSSTTKLRRLWVTRKRVLDKARKVHGTCRVCRQAVAANRVNFIQFVVMPRIREIAASELLALCVRSPDFALGLATVSMHQFFSRARVAGGAVVRRLTGRRP